MENKNTGIKCPLVAVDTVALTVSDNQLQVLLIKIGSGPYQNKWALPGGLVSLNETTDEAALRVLRQKTNIHIGHLEQVYTFSDINRDVRSRAISVAYMLLINDKTKLDIVISPLYLDAQWFDVNQLPPLAFDHKNIISLTYKRLCDKTTYSNIAHFLSAETFTLTELQHIYESILGRKIDKRNFRKKITSLKMVKPTNSVRHGISRPAKIYRFSETKVLYF